MASLVMIVMTAATSFYFMVSFLVSIDEHDRKRVKPGYWTRIVGVYVIMMANFGLGQIITAVLTGNFTLAPAIIYAASLSLFFLFVLFMILSYRSGKKRA